MSDISALVPCKDEKQHQKFLCPVNQRKVFRLKFLLFKHHAPLTCHLQAITDPPSLKSLDFMQCFKAQSLFILLSQTESRLNKLESFALASFTTFKDIKRSNQVLVLLHLCIYALWSCYHC